MPAKKQTMSIPDQIRAGLAAKGWTARDLAHALGYAPKTTLVHRWLWGEHVPNDDAMQALADALERTMFRPARVFAPTNDAGKSS